MTRILTRRHSRRLLASALLIAAACGAASGQLPKAIRGRIEDKTYFSQANNRAVTIKVYTPPDYGRSRERYPVVYNLHGGGGSPERQWGGVGATLVDAVEGRGVRPMIYVFASGLGDTLFVDTAGTKKQAETTAPRVRRTYSTGASSRRSTAPTTTPMFAAV